MSNMNSFQGKPPQINLHNQPPFPQPSINGSSTPNIRMPSAIGVPPNQTRPTFLGNGPYQPSQPSMRPGAPPMMPGQNISHGLPGHSRPPLPSGDLSLMKPQTMQNMPPRGPFGIGPSPGGQVRPGGPPPMFGPQSGTVNPMPSASNVQHSGPGLPQPTTANSQMRPGMPATTMKSIQQLPTDLNRTPLTNGPHQPGIITPHQPGMPIQEQSDELPVPFHGHGQYSHQVGMQLTSGLTPNNSEPPSQKSSRTPSPMNINQTFDALEGQFTPTKQTEQGNMTPPMSQEIQGRGTPTKPQYSQPIPPTGMNSAGFGPPTGMQVRPGPPSVPTQNVGMGPPSGPGTFKPGQTIGPPTFNVQSRPPSGPPPTGNIYKPGPPSGPLNYGMPPTGTPSGQNFGMPPTTGPPSGPQNFGMSPVSGPPSVTQTYGMPPTSGQYSTPGMMPPPPTGYMPPSSGPTAIQTRPGYPPSSQGMMTQPQGYGPPGSQPQGDGYNPGQYSTMPNIGGMSLSDDSRVVNLLQEKQLMPADGIENPKIKLHNDFKKVNCNPDIFRCTLTSIPQTSALLNKCRLPLGILIHPFKDLSELSQLPVIQSNVIVRCRSCRTYINPFVYFVDQRRWKCNLCYRVNELPEEFNFDPVTKTYGEPQRRPEIKSATIEFIAPSEYMLRPPQPAVYLYLLDVSFNAIETGYLSVFCQTLLDELDKIPSDSRSQIGFLCYDSALYFFNLEESLSQPQMLIVSDVDDVFLPCPDNLLVNLHESKEMVTDLLNQLPNMFENNRETGSALGAALQAAYKLVHPTGGRITVVQTVLPTVGPGALESREDPNQRTTKTVSNLGPSTDFYKKLALDCSAQQVAVDLIMLNGQYADISSISCISKYSGGCIQYYPSFHCVKNPSLTEKFETDLRRYLTRKIGFESVMRIRCTKGLSIHTFHGNFFVRSTDLLSLPNINPDAGFGMQMSVEDPLTENSVACFQAALLYTSSKGERRIRVHTMCLPVTNQLSEIYAGADQQAIVGLLAKMAADRSVAASLPDAREALINAALDSLSAFGSTLTASQRAGSLPMVYSLRLLPLLIAALVKFVAFRFGVNTRLDDRVFAMQQCKSLPLQFLIQSIYPHLYPIHKLGETTVMTKNNTEVPQTVRLQLTAANIDSQGVYLLDTYDQMYFYVGSAVSDQFCQDVLDVPNYVSIPEGIIDLPELENPTSEKIRTFISYLLDNRPGGTTFYVLREDSKLRMEFFQYMVDDRTESSMSYYEFLQHLQKQVKS